MKISQKVDKEKKLPQAKKPYNLSNLLIANLCEFDTHIKRAKHCMTFIKNDFLKTTVVYLSSFCWEASPQQVLERRCFQA